MKWLPLQVVAISTEPGAVISLREERKMLEPKHFRKSAQGFMGIHVVIFMHQLPVVY
jgi:hypothetical protein